MRVLVACEESGRVRDAFKALGHDATSCDIVATDVPGKHYQGDVRDILYDGWDLMVAHPPCTYLSNSGVGHLYIGKTQADKKALGYQINQERWALMEEAAEFFNLLWNAPIEHIAIENPIMHGFGIERVGGRATQFVQPYEHGHGESKRTGLRLKNLPKLVPSNPVEGREQKVWKMGPSPERQKLRSRTYPGIATAMATQWSAYIESRNELEQAA